MQPAPALKAQLSVPETLQGVGGGELVRLEQLGLPSRELDRVQLRLLVVLGDACTVGGPAS